MVPTRSRSALGKAVRLSCLLITRYRARPGRRRALPLKQPRPFAPQITLLIWTRSLCIDPERGVQCHGCRLAVRWRDCEIAQARGGSPRNSKHARAEPHRCTAIPVCTALGCVGASSEATSHTIKGSDTVSLSVRRFVQMRRTVARRKLCLRRVRVIECNCTR